jgi:hypothetical protein
LPGGNHKSAKGNSYILFKYPMSKKWLKRCSCFYYRSIYFVQAC